MRKIPAILMIVLLGLGLWSVAGAASFPQRPVKIVVYTKPGGAIDVFARKFAGIAERISGKRFLIINKPGAGGVIALKNVKKSRPDGLTIAAVTKSNIGKIASADADLSVDDFAWLAMMVRDPEALIVSRKSDLKTWRDVLRQARQSGGGQKWLGPAQGGNDHITAQKVWRKTGMAAKWIPYQGGDKAMAALMGGHGEVYVGNPGDILGKEDLRAVAVSSQKRLNGQFAEVPTFAEAGIRGLDNEIMWRGFLAAKNIPAEAKVFYLDLFQKVSADSEWQNYISKSGAEPVNKTPKEFLAQVKADLEDFRGILTDLEGAKAE